MALASRVVSRKIKLKQKIVTALVEKGVLCEECAEPLHKEQDVGSSGDYGGEEQLDSDQEEDEQGKKHTLVIDQATRLKELEVKINSLGIIVAVCS